jgi:acylglycerol lipase
VATTHSEGHFEGFDGTRLYEQAWLPTAPPRGFLTLVHGLKDHSSRYDAISRQLNEAGFGVYAFDLRGHGKSDGRKVFVRSFDEYVKDLTRFVKRVRTHAGDRPVFLLGHSMGGAIVALYALSQGNGIQGFALSAPGLKVTDDVTPGRVRAVKFISKIAPGAHVYYVPNALFSRDPKVVADMDHDPLIDQRKLPAKLAVEFLGAMLQVQTHASEITVPFLVMHGTGDRLTNPKGSQDLYQRASSTDKALKLYEGLYHDLLHEPEAATVYGDVLGWLDSHTPR